MAFQYLRGAYKLAFWRLLGWIPLLRPPCSTQLCFTHSSKVGNPSQGWEEREQGCSSGRGAG